MFLYFNYLLYYRSLKAFLFLGPQNLRQRAVVEAFMHAWNAYKKYAWGHDELKPLSKSYQEWFRMGLTIVDSLDTIYIMGLKDGKYIFLR